MRVYLVVIFLILVSGCNWVGKRSNDIELISAETLTERYKKLWESVDENMPLPSLTAHIGASKGRSTSIWVLTDDKIYKPKDRLWNIMCPSGGTSVKEIIYDQEFRIAQLVIDRVTDLDKPALCTLSLGVNETQILLPVISETRREGSEFSFLAYSCNEPFTTSERDGKQGILSRDISLWNRMESRAKGENSNGQLPSTPRFVMGVGDQIYVDPDPKEDSPLAFFGGKRSNEWLIESDEKSLYSAFRTVYRYNFSAPHVSKTFSNISSKMMWDDHEIRDGWGSQGDETTDAWRKYFKIARHAFIANQLLRTYLPGDIDQAEYDRLVSGNDPLHQIYSEGKRSHFLMLDSRSNRGVSASLFDEPSSKAVDEWLGKGSSASGDLYVLTVGTPLFQSRRIESIPKIDKTEIADDLRDSWGHSSNAKARNAIAQKLFEHFSVNQNDRLLVVSGDVHFSSILYLSIDGRVFGQEIVTSGIAHSLPTAAMKANFLIDVTAPISGIKVVPAGKINHSATFSEVIVRERDSASPPAIDLVFHSNGTKVGNLGFWFLRKPTWVLGNTNINSSDKRYWYHTYNYNFDNANEHLTVVPENVTPAGLIIPLTVGALPKLKVGLVNNNVLSTIQSQSVFCSVANADYNSDLATDWNLKNLDSCIPLASPE